MGDRGALSHRDQRQRLWHHGVERLCAQAAPHHQQVQRPAAARKTFDRAGLLREGAAQRVAHPRGVFQHTGEGREHFARHPCQHLVGHTCNRILFVQKQRFAQQHGHQAGRQRDVTTKTQHHVRLYAAHHLHTLPAGLGQPERQQRQRGQAFAAHTRKIDRLKRKTLRGHQLAFHAGRSQATATQPMHRPAPLPQRLRHGQTREDVATGATGHDECGLAHTRPPLMSAAYAAWHWRAPLFWRNKVFIRGLHAWMPHARHGTGVPTLFWRNKVLIRGLRA